VISQPRGSTGRRTVPNVLVSGKSIGGGDDIAALDQRDELACSLPGLWTMAIT
jgi:glutaredoxin